MWYAYHSGTLATVQWYTGLVRKTRTEKSFNKCRYIENLIRLLFIYMHKIIICGTLNVLNYMQWNVS